MSSERVTIALVGNPNAGKTSIFNAMTGGHQHVGNYPGVTVEKKEGLVKVNGSEAHVVDLPGTYSLTAYSLEERVVRDYITGEKPDVVVDVVDASNLDRNLYLAVQFRELGVPMVIALNMVDMAEKRGMEVDADRLSELLGVPVVTTVARSGKGAGDLLAKAIEVAGKKETWTPLELSYGPDLDDALREIVDKVNGHPYDLEPSISRGAPAGSDNGGATGNRTVGPRWLALKCLEGEPAARRVFQRDGDLSEKIETVCHRVEKHIQKAHDATPESVVAEHRYGYIASISKEVVRRQFDIRLELSDRIDQLVTHSFLGPLFLVGVLYLVYQFVFGVSETPVGWFEAFFGWLSGQAETIIPEGMFQSLVVSGIIDGVGGVLGFVPLIMFMFFAIALLEDTGYMARVAYLMDRLLRIFGLHGNSVIALIVGGGISGGCAVPGVMATRTLSDPKARLATILTVPFMNCGAKLPVYVLLIGAFFASQQANMMFVLTLISWGLALVTARILRWTVIKGESAPFVMELPPYRLPSFKGLIIHMWERTWLYIKKAGTVILTISIVIWAMMTFPGLPEDQSAQWDARLAAASDEDTRTALAGERAEAELSYSLAGRLGRSLLVVTAPLGFDWRTNVALIGGFAAKEVIVSTLGTAWSIGDVDPEETDTLGDRLRKSPGWTPLAAFALMIFVMVYAPCFVTVVVIAREVGWRWALFGLVYSTVLAYVLALLVYQGGHWLGIG